MCKLAFVKIFTQSQEVRMLTPSSQHLQQIRNPRGTPTSITHEHTWHRLRMQHSDVLHWHTQQEVHDPGAERVPLRDAGRDMLGIGQAVSMPSENSFLFSPKTANDISQIFGKPKPFEKRTSSLWRDVIKCLFQIQRGNMVPFGITLSQLHKTGLAISASATPRLRSVEVSLDPCLSLIAHQSSLHIDSPPTAHETDRPEFGRRLRKIMRPQVPFFRNMRLSKPLPRRWKSTQFFKPLKDHSKIRPHFIWPSGQFPVQPSGPPARFFCFKAASQRCPPVTSGHDSSACASSANVLR